MLFNSNKLIFRILIYIIIFSIVIFILGNLTYYFYTNIINLQENVSAVSDSSNFNLYFLNVIRKDNTVIKKYGEVGDDSSYYITFQNADGTTDTFIKLDDMIYFNNIKICENVNEFKIVVDKSDKESISVELEINDQLYNLQYVLN